MHDTHVFVFESMELQKKMPWFCVHEPVQTDDGSQGSGGTEKSGGTVMETSS